MSDPTRWLDPNSDASRDERALLRTGGEMKPPEGARAAIWASLVTAVPPGAGGGGDGGAGGPMPSHPAPAAPPVLPAAGAAKAAAAAGSSAKAGAVASSGALASGVAKTGALAGVIALAKPFAVGAAAVGAVLAAHASFTASQDDHGDRSTSVVVAPAAVPTVAPRGAATNLEPARDNTAAPSPISDTHAPPAAEREPAANVGVRETGSPKSPSAADPQATSKRALPDTQLSPLPNADNLPTQTPLALPTAEAPPSSEVPPATDVAESPSALLDESRMLASAREALRRGDASSALRLLEAIASKHPAGGLVQERESLAIEAIASSGRRAEAASRAAAFLRAYPNSPHSARVQSFVSY